MSSTVGLIKTVAIRKVWPTENGDFTPWLQSHISQLDEVLALGLSDPQREVAAGVFSIDLVAKTDFGDVVIENQFGKSDHRHLGQLVTYLSQREVQRAIWIVEQAKPEHVKAVRTLNGHGVWQIWIVTVRAIKIDNSAPAPLFTVVAEPSEDTVIREGTDPDLTPAQRQKRDFMAALFAQARDERIDSPFKNLKPDYIGMHETPAGVPGLVYRVAVNRRESRVVLTNKKGRCTGALAVLLKNRQRIKEEFAVGGLPQPLEWTEQVTARRWVIRYRVDVNYQDKPDRTKMRELNRASDLMKRVFDPHVRRLDPLLDEDSSEPSTEVLDATRQ